MSVNSIDRRMALRAGAIAVVAVATSAFAQAANDYLIIPGERLGEIHLGMSVAQVRDVMGAPSETFQDAHGNAEYTFGETTVRIIRGRVTVIMTSDSNYSMTNGLRVGSQDFDVRAELGEPRRVEVINGTHRSLDYRGVSVSERHNVVSGFQVFSR